MGVWWRAYTNTGRVTALANFTAALFARYPVMFRTNDGRDQYFGAYTVNIFESYP